MKVKFGEISWHWIAYMGRQFLQFFERTFNHAPGPCHRLPIIEHGSEDIQVLPSGLAFISSGIRLRDNAVYRDRVGRIYSFDFNSPLAEPQELPINAAEGFQLSSPHGISVWTDPNSGNVYLYVISHHPVEAVDKFLFDPSSKTLTRQRRIAEDPNFHQLNDLVVVGDDQFFFTNYYYTNDMFEFVFGLRWGSFGFFDGARSTQLSTGLFIPNGISTSPDGRFLYVGHAGDEEVLVYTRNNDNSVKFSHAIKLWTKMDNLDVDKQTGDIWIAAHPVAYKALRYIEDPVKHTSPSQVLRVKMSADGQAEKIEEVYSNDGSELSASSVAVVHGKAMLVGSVASHAIYCELN